MTKEEKELLTKDLCARLPYGVILQVGIFDNGDIKYHNKKLDYQLLSLIELDGGYYSNGLLCKYNQFTAKPYLRTMSSMTDEEKEEFEELFIGYSISRNRNCVYHARRGDLRLEIIDWLNAHHFDYRGLIKMGLALEAPNEIYNN